MAWLQATIQADSAVAEKLADVLMDVGALSATIEDALAGTDDEQPIFGEPGEPVDQLWQHSLINTLFAEDADVDLLIVAAANQCRIAVPSYTVGRVEEQDWVRLTQSQFAPVDITPTFWIVPSWHEPPAAAQQIIRLDPGLAFGTGTHPTTRMCLRWIAQRDLSGQRVLDYGCGSGILAIGAAKFGASEIVAVDIDPAAVESTHINAANNHVTLQVGLPDVAQGSFNVVLANILATPLKVLAPLLCAHVATGGHLVLAGILERQAQELQEAYAPYLVLNVADSEDGWILMTATAAR